MLTRIELKNVYLLPNKNGVVEPVAQQDGWYFIPVLRIQEPSGEAANFWLNGLRDKDVEHFIKKGRIIWHVAGPAIDRELSNKHQRVVESTGEESIWAGVPLKRAEPAISLSEGRKV